MDQDIKDEAIEQIELDVKFGFDTPEEIFDNIDMSYEEEDIDEGWLKQTIHQRYNQHQKEALHWTKPTDFDKLAQAFDQLIAQKIVCLHNAGYTKQDGEGDCMETIDRLKQQGIKATGFCYYHSQDLARAVDPESRNLYLGFDSPTQNDEEALIVAKMIVDALTQNGLQVSWPGTVDQRIQIINLDWKKIPDKENWGAERVMQIMRKPGGEGKPFWKIW
jgi:hypothetical protein